jgi:hypothetical protein
MSPYHPQLTIRSNSLENVIPILEVYLKNIYEMKQTKESRRCVSPSGAQLKRIGASKKAREIPPPSRNDSKLFTIAPFSLSFYSVP